MADNLKKRGKADRSYVNAHQIHEIRYWSKRLECSQLELVLATRLAVRIGGALASPDDVAEQLQIAETQIQASRKRARL